MAGLGGANWLRSDMIAMPSRPRTSHRRPVLDGTVTLGALPIAWITRATGGSAQRPAGSLPACTAAVREALLEHWVPDVGIPVSRAVCCWCDLGKP